MTRGVRVRLMLFVVLSAVGIVYVSANYLGIVDKVLGRGVTVYAELPKSGGVFVGSEVTYRGVKVGNVSDMEVLQDGARLTLELQEGTRLPLSSKVYVHNLSAVGEQYVDFEPDSKEGPYATEGSTINGDMDSLPVPEEELLLSLNTFVQSVDRDALKDTVRELGVLFNDTGTPLERMIDGGTTFIDEATASESGTDQLLNSSLRVLRTQREQGDNLRSLSTDLAAITQSLKKKDPELRSILADAPSAVREAQILLDDLEPTLPVLLGNLVTVDSVVAAHMEGIEQLLVTFPSNIATGFTGTQDGYGHVNLQFDQTPSCTKGYKPLSEWRRGTDLTDGPIFPARCAESPPLNMRGNELAPPAKPLPSPQRNYVGTRNPATGIISGVVGPRGQQVRMRNQADLSLLGKDSWKWLIMAPVADQ